MFVVAKSSSVMTFGVIMVCFWLYVSYADVLYSGIANGIVFIVKICYTHVNAKIFFLHLFTDLFRKNAFSHPRLRE